MKRKVNNLQRRTSSPHSVKNKEVVNELESESEDELKIDARKIYNKKNVVDDINSDLENLSLK